MGEAATLTGSIPDITAEVRIGVDQDTDYPFDGWIDELRISKGIARWTEDFTPPAPEINNNQISRYSPDTDSFQNYVSNPTFDEFNTLEYGKGYAIYVDNPSGISVNVTGTTPEPESITLSEGWNLIPYPYLSKRSIEEGLGNLQLGVDYDLVKSYNTSTEATDKFETFPGSLTQLQPNKSYYIHCLKDTAWSLEPLSRTTKFYYDGDGGRVKRVSEIDQGETTVYIGSLYEVETVDSSQKIVVSKHIYAGSNRIAVVKSSADYSLLSTNYYHSDHLGSSNLITNDTGEQVALYEYSPFGEVSRQTGSYDTDVRYTGKIQDDTGLYYYGARYYDPVIGRFITPDSLIQAPYDPQSLNRYSYCRNNPINLVDPTGRFFWAAIIGAILGGISAAISGGNVWQGVLGGLVGGAFIGIGYNLLEVTGAVVGGILGGAASAGITGGHPGYGALAGGIGAFIGGNLGQWASGWNSGSFWGQLGGAVIGGAVAGGLGAELAGGKFGEGAGMGAAFAAAGFFAGKGVNGLDPRRAKAAKYEQDVKKMHDLNVKKGDMVKVEITSRKVIGPANHLTAEGWEMGPEYPGGPISTTNKVGDLSDWGTYKHTQNAKQSGNFNSVTTDVSASGLVDAIELYQNTWAGGDTIYNAASYNSNYAVNTVIYAAGGSVPGGLGLTPQAMGTPSYLMGSNVYHDRE